VALITEWRDEDGNVEVRSEKSDLGGTMRLAQQCQLAEDSLVRQLYGEPTITERHRHRYEVNNMLLKPIEWGLRVAGRSGMISWSRSSANRTIRGSLPVSSIRSLLRRRVMAILLFASLKRQRVSKASGEVKRVRTAMHHRVHCLSGVLV
jgi:CTP synthase